MKCEKLQGYLPDMIFDPTRVPAEAMQHVKECPACAGELKELQATMQLLDSWKAPEPSPYFDTRLAVRLREAESLKRPDGWSGCVYVFCLEATCTCVRQWLRCLLCWSSSAVVPIMGVVSLNHTVAPPHHHKRFLPP